MPKLLTRIVAVLVAACLMADPVRAMPIHRDPSAEFLWTRCCASYRGGQFASQALAPRLLEPGLLDATRQNVEVIEGAKLIRGIAFSPTLPAAVKAHSGQALADMQTIESEETDFIAWLDRVLGPLTDYFVINEMAGKLVSNAYKALVTRAVLQRERDYQPRIDVNYSFETSGRFQLQVSDNGIGITPEVLGKMMEKRYSSMDDGEPHAEVYPFLSFGGQALGMREIYHAFKNGPDIITRGTLTIITQDALGRVSQKTMKIDPEKIDFTPVVALEGSDQTQGTLIQVDMEFSDAARRYLRPIQVQYTWPEETAHLADITNRVEPPAAPASGSLNEFRQAKVRRRGDPPSEKRTRGARKAATSSNERDTELQVLRKAFAIVRSRAGTLRQIRRMDRFEFARRLGAREVIGPYRVFDTCPLMTVSPVLWKAIERVRAGRMRKEHILDFDELNRFVDGVGVYYSPEMIQDADSMHSFYGPGIGLREGKAGFFHELVELLAMEAGLYLAVYHQLVGDHHPIVREAEFRFAHLLGGDEIGGTVGTTATTFENLNEEESLARNSKDRRAIELCKAVLLEAYEDSLKPGYGEESMKLWKEASRRRRPDQLLEAA